MKRLFDLITELNDLKDNLELIANEKPVEFVRKRRGTWAGVPQNTVWRVLIAKRKNVMVTEDRRGYEVVDVDINSQFVVGTKSTRDMLFSTDRETRELAKAALDSIANKKYK